MGVYDKQEFHLTCCDCGAEEAVIFLGQGEGWGFPDWAAMAAVTKFNVVITDGDVTKPRLEAKDCKNCGGTNIAIEAS